LVRVEPRDGELEEPPEESGGRRAYGERDRGRNRRGIGRTTGTGRRPRGRCRLVRDEVRVETPAERLRHAVLRPTPSPHPRLALRGHPRYLAPLARRLGSARGRDFDEPRAELLLRLAEVVEARKRGEALEGEDPLEERCRAVPFRADVLGLRARGHRPVRLAAGVRAHRGKDSPVQPVGGGRTRPGAVIGRLEVRGWKLEVEAPNF